MPIRPQHKWFYPIDWPQLSAMIRFERAKGRCERCGRPHRQEIQHLGDGRWWDEENGPGAMDAGGLYDALLELMTTSLFAQPGSCWRPRTLTTIPTITGYEI
jgi:hypothetical protein